MSPPVARGPAGRDIGRRDIGQALARGGFLPGETYLRVWVPRRYGAPRERLRAWLRRSSRLPVAVAPATLSTGLALHALAQSALAGDTGDADALGAVLARWLPPALARAMQDVALAERVAWALRLADGDVSTDTPEASSAGQAPSAETAQAVDWNGLVARFCAHSGVGARELLETVPWRAFPALMTALDERRALDLLDAATAAAAGMGSEESVARVNDALAAHQRKSDPATPQAREEAAAAGRARVAKFFGYRVR